MQQRTVYALTTSTPTMVGLVETKVLAVFETEAMAAEHLTRMLLENGSLSGRFDLEPIDYYAPDNEAAQQRADLAAALDLEPGDMPDHAEMCRVVRGLLRDARDHRCTPSAPERVTLPVSASMVDAVTQIVARAAGYEVSDAKHRTAARQILDLITTGAWVSATNLDPEGLERVARTIHGGMGEPCSDGEWSRLSELVQERHMRRAEQYVRAYLVDETDVA